MYERAVDILEHMAGRPIMESERAALHAGFHVAQRGDMEIENDTGCVWELVATAARRAAIGEGVKVRKGEDVVTLVTYDTHHEKGC